MLQSLLRSQRAAGVRGLHSLAAASSAAAAAQRTTSSIAAAAAAALPHSLSSSSSSSLRFLSSAAPPRRLSKKAAAAAAAEADSALAVPTDGQTEYDEFNLIPAIPKPKAEELDALCLTEEQLRFARRPMPSSEHRQQLLPSVYLGPKPIAQHTAADLGKYYTVRDTIMGAIPPQIHRSMSQEYMGGGQYHMVRQPGLQIVRAMKQIEEVGARTDGKLPYALKKRVFGVRGNSGCGKSAALHYAAQFAREQSEANPDRPWLVVATRGEEFARETQGFIAPSTVKPGVFDQALYTMTFFANLLRTEAEALKKIKLKRHIKYEDVQWPEGQKGETLFDLVTLASTDRAQAPRLLYDFTAELKRSTEVPVLVLVDALNVWDQVTDFVEPLTYKKMEARRLALVDAFSWFTQKPPGNGLSVWSLTTQYATLKHSFRHFTFPAVEGLDSFWYSQQEFKHCLVHYSVSEFILSDIDQELLVRINGLTGKVPREVFKQAFFR